MLDKYPLEKVIEKESFLPALGELFKSTNGYRGKKKRWVRHDKVNFKLIVVYISLNHLVNNKFRQFLNPPCDAAINKTLNKIWLFLGPSFFVAWLLDYLHCEVKFLCFKRKRTFSGPSKSSLTPTPICYKSS